MKTKIFNIVNLLLVLTTTVSCEKELEMDYKTVDQLYVVEAELSNQRTRIAVSKTRQIENDGNKYGVDGAVIRIMGDDGSEQTLTTSTSGIYTSNTKGVPGVTYRIEVEVDGKRFTSSSTMQKTPVVNSARFIWKKVLNTKVLFADLRIQDFPDETNYYFMHIYRNGLGYRWAVMKDVGNPGEEVQQLFSCMMEDTDDDDDRLLDGDVMRFEVRAIDKLSYDYLISMQQTSSVSTNPIANFSGGCLGYFSAYGKTNYSITFRSDEVEEE